MKFTFRQLEVFVAVARGENVSQAAAAIHLSQSATSAALGELERQAGQPLFDRRGKSLRLNDFGRALLPRADELLERGREVEALFAGRDDVGELNVGATLTIGNYLATLIVVRHLAAYPDARVRLEVSNSARIVEQLHHFDVDLGLLESPVRDPALVEEAWIADELAVFCAPTHPLATRGALTLDELAQATWILRERGSGTRAAFDRALHAVTVPLEVRLELQHTEAIKRAVEAGLGLGCLSRLALRDAVRRGSLVALATPDLDLRRTFYFVTHRDKYPTRALQRFVSACRAFVAGAARADEIDLPFVP